MSMEIHVFSDKPLPPIAAWQQAIDAEGFDLKLDPDVEFETASGFCPRCRAASNPVSKATMTICASS